MIANQDLKATMPPEAKILIPSHFGTKMLTFVAGGTTINLRSGRYN